MAVAEIKIKIRNSTTVGENLNRIAERRRSYQRKRQKRIAGALAELSFRKPIEVNSVRRYSVSDYCYAVCPRCGYAMERDYQQYCEVCGQRLAWKIFSRGKVKVQQIVGLEWKEQMISKK